MPAKILVVEDNSDSRDMLTLLLESEGFKVLSAEDGNAGIDIAQADCPDLIITDINMPNLDGIEMIKRLRVLPKCSSIPILVLTAYGDIDMAWALNAGASQFMNKPLEYGLLKTVVRQLISL
jgi:CheY-like chemotaxis protein